MFQSEGLDESIKYGCLTTSAIIYLRSECVHQWGSNHGLQNNGESGPLCFYHSMDHNFYTWPWNDTSLKIFLHTGKSCFGHRSVVAVLCLLFQQLKTENCIISSDTTSLYWNFFSNLRNLYYEFLDIAISRYSTYQVLNKLGNINLLSDMISTTNHHNYGDQVTQLFPKASESTIKQPFNPSFMGQRKGQSSEGKIGAKIVTNINSYDPIIIIPHEFVKTSISSFEKKKSNKQTKKTKQNKKPKPKQTNKKQNKTNKKLFGNFDRESSPCTP